MQSMFSLVIIALSHFTVLVLFCLNVQLLFQDFEKLFLKSISW